MDLFLARLPMEPVGLLTLIFGFIALMTITQNRAKERKERLRVIEDAIKNGNLEPDVKQELVGELTGRRPHRRRPHVVPGPEIRGKFVFGIGWLGLFTGIGLMLMGERDVFEAGCLMTALSFGVVSLPLALRELDARKRA